MDITARVYIGIVLTLTALSTVSHGLGTTLIEGDVYIELIASIYSKSHANGTCYDLDTESVQNIEAARWVLEKLNKKHLHNGNKGIGLRVSYTCRSVSKAERLAFNLAQEMSKHPHMKTIGVLGADYSSEAQAISRLLGALPGKYRLPMVGYRTTAASLNNSELYSNFIRTIPSDVIQTKVMASFVKQLNWTYMALVYDDNSYGRGGVTSLLKEANCPDICFPVLIPCGDVRQQNIENQLLTQVLNATVPVHGIIVYGDTKLAEAVLTATENILLRFPTISRPTFLFSEGSGYIHGNGNSKLKGYYVLSPPRRNVTEFEESFRYLFRNTENIYNMPRQYAEWLKEVYRLAFDCVFPANKSDNTCPAPTDTEIISKLHPSIFNQYAIQAALVLVGIEQNVRRKLCPGLDFCMDLFSSSRHVYLDQIANLSVDFDFDFGDVRIAAFRDPVLVVEYSGTSDATLPKDVPLYEVYNKQLCNNVPNTTCLVKVAHMSLDTFETTTSNIRDYDKKGNERKWPNITKAQCPDSATCSLCHKNIMAEPYLFEPGDMYIVGISPVHNPGSSPLQCGTIKTGLYDTIQAMKFAVKEAKMNYKDSIPVSKIGLIIIDSCNDPHIVQERIISLHRHGVYQNNKYIPVADKIIGYVGGFSSDISVAVAEVSNRLGFVQISYGSTAPSLSNRRLYPYFLRTPSRDDFQAESILNIVKQLGANLIQLVHSDSTYGTSGSLAIAEKAKLMDICLDKTHKFSSFKDTNDLLESLRSRSDARVVVLFLSTFDFDRLIPALKGQRFKQGEFAFIFSDGLGNRYDISEFRNLLGSVTLRQELSLNEKFKEHLKQLKPVRSTTDPWVREYMEKVFQCYYEWSYNKTSGQACTGKETIDVYRINYTVDIWSPFADRAIMALLKGARIALDKQCGHSRNVCDTFRQNPLELVAATRGVRFKDESGNPVRVFDDNGDGKAGFKFYVLDMEGETVQYKKIGGSTPAFVFDMQSYPKQVNVLSSCAEQDICKHCFPSDERNGIDHDHLWMWIVLPVLLLVCLVLLGFVLYVCKGRGCCLKIENRNLKLVKGYLTPSYDRSRMTCTQVESGHYVTIRDTHHEYACPHRQRCSCSGTVQPKREQRDTASSSYCEIITGNVLSRGNLKAGHSIQIAEAEIVDKTSKFFESSDWPINISSKPELRDEGYDKNDKISASQDDKIVITAGAACAKPNEEP